MSDKEIAMDLIRRLPEGVSLREIAAGIEFIAGIREGLVQIDRGETVPLEDAEEKLPSWLTR